jgi:hypothetical protein
MPTVVMSFMGNMYGTEGVIDADDPPAFVVNATADASQYYPSAQAMVNQMNSVGVYNEFQTIVGGSHTLNISTFNLVMPNGNTILENNILFLANYLVPEPSTLALAGCGAAGLVFLARRSRRNWNSALVKTGTGMLKEQTRWLSGINSPARDAQPVPSTCSIV